MARVLVSSLLLLGLFACAPRSYREDADRVATRTIQTHRLEALGVDEPFSIERPSDTLRRRLFVEQGLPFSGPEAIDANAVNPIPQWPDADYFDSESAENVPWRSDSEGLVVQLADALQIGARNSRDYQRQKELVFQSALSLDLARDDFRNIFASLAEGEITRDLGLARPETGARGSASAGVTRRLRNGASFAANVGIDVVKLLTRSHSSSLGVFGDASISVPLLRGSGQFVVTEPLKQAERNLVYSIYDFERFKRDFAVRIATDYLGVLQQLDQVQNAEDNYRGLIRSTRRARRLADAGRVPEIQVDQSRQDELSSRNRWISALQSYERSLDRFKTLLGLPTDARIRLDASELVKLENVITLATTEVVDDEPIPAADVEVTLDPPSQADAGPLELDEATAIELALTNRLDLRVAIARVLDSQRGVAIAADDLRADLTLFGSATAGSGRSVSGTGLSDSGIRPERGRYSSILTLDLPFERTAERNAYRNSLIAFEQSVRDVQALEDSIKFDVRDDLRTLLEARESLRIQLQAVQIAQRRVASTNLFLQAGRAEIRDLLEAQEDLVSARNALTSARVQYRVSELELQRDLDVLQVDAQGLWREYTPKEKSS